MEVKEKGYLYILTGELEENVIRENIHDAITNYFGNSIKYQLILNVVENRDKMKMGYSHGWVNNIEVYNFLIGLKPDGEKLVKYIEKEIKTTNLTLNDNWGDMENYDEIIEVPLSPILKLKSIPKDGEHLKIIIKPSSLEINNDLDNSIYCNKLEKWIDINLLYKYFSKFNDDFITYNDNKKRKFKYPIIKLKDKKGENYNTCTIIFSPKNRYTAYFVVNLVRKLKITKGDKSQLLFFNQGKKRVYYN